MSKNKSANRNTSGVVQDNKSQLGLSNTTDKKFLDQASKTGGLIQSSGSYQNHQYSYMSVRHQQQQVQQAQLIKLQEQLLDQQKYQQDLQQQPLHFMEKTMPHKHNFATNSNKNCGINQEDCQNSGRANQDSLWMFKNKEIHKKSEELSNELRDKIFSSHHGKLNQNLQTLSPNTKENFNNINTNRMLTTHNVTSEGFTKAIKENYPRDLTPQSTRRRMKDNQSNKLIRNFFSPPIENNKRHKVDNHYPGSPPIKGHEVRMSDIKNFNKTSYQRLSHADNYNQHINKEGLQSPDLRDFKNYNKEYYTEAKEFQNIQKSPDIDAHKQHQEQQEDITSDIRDMIKLQQDKKTNTFQNIMNNLTRNMSDAHEKTNMQSQLTGKHNGLNPNKSCMSSDISNKKSPTKISNILASMHGKENSNLLSNHTQQNHIAKTLLNMDNGGVKVNQMLSEMNVLNSDRKVQGNSGNKGINNLNSMNMMNNMNARANKTSPHTKQQAIKKLTSLERQKYACENNEFQPSRSNSSESTIDKMKSHIIHENILEVLYSNGLDSQTKVGEMIFQMLKSMKKSGDPYELIRNYTDLIQDPIYDIIVEMFSDTFTQAEINNSLKLERWGIIFLFYFNLIGKLDEKISPNLINLLTHILQNFHILVELIHKNAKFYKKGHIMAKLRGILDCLNNPYMDVNSEVLTVLKRNNDIIKCNLKAW